MFIFAIFASFVSIAQTSTDHVLKKTDKVLNYIGDKATATTEYAGNSIKNTGNYIKETAVSIDTSSTTKMVAKKIISGVESLASGLKVGAEKVFQIYCTKIRIEGIVGCVFYTIIMIIFVTRLSKIKLLASLEEFNFPLIILYIAGIIVCTAGFFKGQYILKAFIPEYFTIEMILNTAKQLM